MCLKSSDYCNLCTTAKLSQPAQLPAMTNIA